MEPSDLIDSLTGCPPDVVARSCDADDLRAARLLIDEALELQHSGPRLRVVRAVRAG